MWQLINVLPRHLLGGGFALQILPGSEGFYFKAVVLTALSPRLGLLTVYWNARIPVCARPSIRA